MKTKLTTPVIYLIIAVLIFVFLTSWAKWIILGLLIIAAVVYFGEDKCLEVVRGIFKRGKQAVEDIPSKNVDEELTVRDVVCNSIEGGKFQLEVVTEKGLMKLRPQPFNVIPEVLQKGKKIRHRVIYTMDKLIKVQKEETISAVGNDGEERIFYVEN